MQASGPVRVIGRISLIAATLFFIWVVTVRLNVGLAKRPAAPPVTATVFATEVAAPGAASTQATAARTPHAPPRPGEVREMEIKDLGNFDYEHDPTIPQDVARLSGMKVRLRGFIIPLEEADEFTNFVLVPSLFTCCFGQPPQIQHVIKVHCKGKKAFYTQNRISVEGTLAVRPLKEDGYVTSIFQIAADEVKPAPEPR